MPTTPPQATASGSGPPRGDGVALELAHLRKAFAGGRKRPQRTALDDLSLIIPRGQWVALLGPNGSGKSTLVRIISGVLAADSGSACVADHAAGERAAQARISVVFQKPGLDPLLTVRENLRAAAALSGLRGAARESRIDDLSRRFGIAERLADRVSSLSGGLVRRVDLARALLHRPELLILDEATAGLDHKTRTDFLDTVADLRREDPALSILMTTHLMDEAERAERVVMMARGRIVADGTPAELRSPGGSGERIIRAGPVPAADIAPIEAALRESGLIARRLDEQHLDARAHANADLDRAVLHLARRGIPFEVAPPNLGDVYLALTGSGLNPGDAGDPP